jgi:hypothetical protein
MGRTMKVTTRQLSAILRDKNAASEALDAYQAFVVHENPARFNYSENAKRLANLLEVLEKEGII